MNNLAFFILSFFTEMYKCKLGKLIYYCLI